MRRYYEELQGTLDFVGEATSLVFELMPEPITYERSNGENGKTVSVSDEELRSQYYTMKPEAWQLFAFVFPRGANKQLWVAKDERQRYFTLQQMTKYHFVRGPIILQNPQGKKLQPMMTACLGWRSPVVTDEMMDEYNKLTEKCIQIATQLKNDENHQVWKRMVDGWRLPDKDI